MTPSESYGGRAAVIGAGVVGMATALSLQRDGHRVTVFDPVPPGESCSSGNAGLFASYAVAPVQTPGIVWRVPGMLVDPLSPLALRWRYLPVLVPWLLRFVMASGQDRVEAISKALAALLADATSSWRVLIDEAGAGDLLREGDILILFGAEKDWRGAQYLLDLRRRRGVAIEEIGVDEAHRLEPALAPVFKRAAVFPDNIWCVDPLALVRRLAARFVASGGVIEGARITGLDPRDGGGANLHTDDGAHEAEIIAVCAGAWSKRLAAMLGCAVPLDTERGYHVMLEAPGGLLSRPVNWYGGGFYMTPMEGGLRCAGTVELGGLDAPPDPNRAAAIERQVRRILPDAGPRQSEWLGFRPSMPDSMPVIGPAPGHPGIWFNFGHGHLGLTLAAVSGRIIADLAAGRTPGLDTGAYAASRF
ncbi:MAG: FAD-binding oxidoreductase [Alphaproteobacteria bacterium]